MFSYWGWGAEDDDLYKRIKHAGYRIKNIETDEHVNWLMVSHQGSHAREGNPENPDRFKLKDTAEKRMESDGLNSLTFKIIEHKQEVLYERFLVDVGKGKEIPNPEGFVNS